MLEQAITAQDKGKGTRTLNEGEARQFALVRAVESEDRDAMLLTREDRMQADAAARGLEGQAYLARRADFAATRLATRNPRVQDVMRYAQWPRWVGWALPLAALLFGFITNEMGNSKRMNIIAFPLVGMFAWNFAVYLGIIGKGLFGMARRGDTKPQGALGKLVARMTDRMSERLQNQDAMGRSLATFLRDWTRDSAKLNGFRAARTLHLGAALFAAGVIGGLYLRALGIEYRAGWESTFLTAGAVQGLVNVLLGPASALTGIALPDVQHIYALNWNQGSNGENAGPWIHLYAASAFLFVIIPRLCLAGWNMTRAFALARKFPVPGREDFYVRRLLRNVQGGAGEVRITPYAYRPSDAVTQRLTRLIRTTFGDATRVQMDAPVDYGAEDDWLGGASLRPETDHHILLFNLSSTPEAENHGAFAAALADKLKAAKQGTAIAAMLDESAYRQRMGGQSGGDARLEARREAWEHMLLPSGMTVLSADLDHEEEPRLSARLESALSRDAAMQEVKR